MAINEGCGISQMYSALILKVINTATNFKYSCCCTKITDSKDSNHCTDCTFSDSPVSSVTDIVEEGESLFCAMNC